MVKSSQEWCNVQVKVNKEEDTERGEFMHIKGCEIGCGQNSNYPIIAFSWSALLYNKHTQKRSNESFY